jgi:hypothetical protein
VSTCPPPVGRCRLCGLLAALHVHVSRVGALQRLVCTPCWSKATLTEEAGHEVQWWPEPAPVDGGLW